MANANYQFLETRNMFRDYLTGYPENITYDEWMKADADDKAALLFVTFYQEITLAWYNAITYFKIVHITQEDAVSTVLQYLMKNVDKISEDKNRYSAQYIYRVCYNCLASLAGSRGIDTIRSHTEISNEYTDGDTTVNLWDLVPSEDEDLETLQTKKAIWDIIKKMGPKAEKVVNHLLNPDDTLRKVSASSSERPIDRLADVSVSKAEYEEILAELKVALAPYKDILFGF